MIGAIAHKIVWVWMNSIITLGHLILPVTLELLEGDCVSKTPSDRIDNSQHSIVTTQPSNAQLWSLRRQKSLQAKVRVLVGRRRAKNSTEAAARRKPLRRRRSHPKRRQELSLSQGKVRHILFGLCFARERLLTAGRVRQDEDQQAQHGCPSPQSTQNREERRCGPASADVSSHNLQMTSIVAF